MRRFHLSHSGSLKSKISGSIVFLAIVLLLTPTWLVSATSNPRSSAQSTTRTTSSSVTDSIGSTAWASNEFVNSIYCFAITASASGTLQTIGVNVATVLYGGGKIDLALYSTYSSGKFSGLLGQSASTAAVAGWNDLSIGSSIQIVSGTTYYICSQSSNTFLVEYASRSGGTLYWEPFLYAPFPSTTGTLTTDSDTYTLNMRMTYT